MHPSVPTAPYEGAPINLMITCVILKNYLITNFYGNYIFISRYITENINETIGLRSNKRVCKLTFSFSLCFCKKKENNDVRRRNSNCKYVVSVYTPKPKPEDVFDAKKQMN